MDNFWRKFLRLFRWARRQPGPRFHAEFVPELPAQPQPWIVYLGCDSDRIVWGGVLQCPCGCRENIHVNFVRGHDAVWTYHVSRDGTVTLSPSVWKNRGCGSHFFVREGVLLWADRCAPNMPRSRREAW
jgi:hypothetical protein